MKSQDSWKPSKYIYKKNTLIASRDQKEVSVGSRLIADLTAKIYNEEVKRYAKGRLLDLGCGKAPLYIVYKDYITENICVDWKNTLHKNEHLDYECDLTKPLPFCDEEFDTIILSDVLEHIPEPELLWKEISRILAKGGKLLMNVPFYYCLHEQPHDYYRYTEFALRRFVDNADLKLVHIKPVGGAPEIMADIFSKNALRLKRIGKPLAMFAQWTTLSFINTKFGAKLSAATTDNFPLAYFLVAEK